MKTANKSKRINFRVKARDYAFCKEKNQLSKVNN